MDLVDDNDDALAVHDDNVNRSPPPRLIAGNLNALLTILLRRRGQGGLALRMAAAARLRGLQRGEYQLVRNSHLGSFFSCTSNNS